MFANARVNETSTQAAMLLQSRNQTVAAAEQEANLLAQQLDASRIEEMQAAQQANTTTSQAQQYINYQAQEAQNALAQLRASELAEANALHEELRQARLQVEQQKSITQQHASIYENQLNELKQRLEQLQTAQVEAHGFKQASDQDAVQAQLDIAAAQLKAQQAQNQLETLHVQLKATQEVLEASQKANEEAQNQKSKLAAELLEKDLKMQQWEEEWNNDDGAEWDEMDALEEEGEDSSEGSQVENPSQVAEAHAPQSQFKICLLYTSDAADE